MKKQGKRILAAALALALTWNQAGVRPVAWASTTPDWVVEDVEDLPDSVLYQTVPYGTPYEDLEFPDTLNVLLQEPEETEDNSEDEDTGKAKTATSSNAEKTATSSNAEKTSTPTNADKEEESSDWQTVTVNWVINENMSIASSYSGEVSGTYVFDVEFDDGYGAGNAILPSITVEVETGDTSLTAAVKTVQDKINGLPDADTITAENSDEVAEQLDDIDSARDKLDELLGDTEDWTEYVDTAKYDAAVARMNELEGLAGAEIITVAGMEETIDTSNIDLPDPDELLLGYFEQQLLGGGYGIELAADYGLNKLTGNNEKIYGLLEEQIKKVASGDETSTEFTITWEDLGLTKTKYTAQELTDATGITVSAIKDGNSLTDAAREAIQSLTDYDLDLIVDVLRINYPYELYWFDKTSGVGGSSVGYSLSSSYVQILGTGFTIGFAVSKDYSASGNTGTYLTGDRPARVATAVATINEIISDNADKSDYEKIQAYSKIICESVDYNYDAAGTGSSGNYGDPWQLINVFDGDEDTKVVCEGYAKAFQYLCDLTEWDNDSVICYTVEGTMGGGTGAGAHMWNILSVNGNNFLVDMTSVDARWETLLSGGLSGEWGGTYTYELDSDNKLTYAYNDDTEAMYTEAELKLADHDATEEDFELPPKTEVTISGVSVGDKTYDGTAVSYSGEPAAVDNDTKETVTIEEYEYIWYQAGEDSDTALSDAPVGTGSYKLVVSVSSDNDTYEGSTTIEFKIEPKTLTGENLEYVGEPIEKTYDGTTDYKNSIVVSVKSGIVEGDTPDITGTGVYDSADVGTDKTVTFTPDAITEGNFRLADTETLIISGARITAKPYDQPEFKIDYVDEKLTGGEPDQSYKWSCGTESGIVTSDENGYLSIEEKFFGTTVTVTRTGTGNYSDSEVQTVEIPARPALDSSAFTVTNESVAGRNDGSIVPISATIAYQYYKNSNDGWTELPTAGLTGLADGEYQVRQAAVKDTSFASEALVLTVEEGAERKYDVTVTAPAFVDVIYGYAQPDAKAITITAGSDNNVTAKITGVSIDRYFKLTGTGEINLAAGESDSNTYTVQPVAGLNASDTEYTATLTVTYQDADGTATAEKTTKAEVKLKVEKATPDVGTVSVSEPDKIYTSTELSDITLSRTNASVPGTLALEEGQTLAAGTDTYNWVFTPEDNDNYESVSGTININVTADTLDQLTVTGTPGTTAYVYGDSFKTDGLTVTAVYISGRTAVVTDKASVSPDPLSVGDTEITLSYTEDGVTKTCKVTGIIVDRATRSIALSDSSVTTTTVNLTAAEPDAGKDDGTIAYGYAKTNDSSQVKNWQTGTSFKGLDWNTTYYFFARVTGGTNYEDAVSEGKAIKTADRAKAEISVEKADAIYDGQPKQGYSGTVSAGDYTGELVYTYYKGETELTGAPTAAGDYRLVIAVPSGNSDYTGSEEVNFTVKKASLEVKAADKKITYGDSAPEAYEATYSGFVNGEDTTVLEDTLTFRCNYKQGSSAGTYEITPAGLTAANYEITFEKGTLTVDPKELGNASVAEIVDQVYSGAEQKPELTVTDGDAQLAENTDYTVAYSDNTDVGEAVVTLTGKGNYTGTVQTKFTIVKAAAPVVTWPEAAEITYGETLSESALTGGSTGYGSFAWKEPDTVFAAGDHSAEVVFTPDAATLKNYEEIPSTVQEVSVSVAKARLTVKADAQSKTYGQDDPALTFVVSGLVGSDTESEVLSGSPERENGENVKDGGYAIGQGTLEVVNSNYELSYTGAVFMITQATPVVEDVTAVSPAVIYPTTLTADITLEAETSVPGTLTLTAGQTLTAGTQEYSWTFEPEDGVNYDTVTGTVSLTVKEDTLVSLTVTGTPDQTEYEDGDSFETAGLTVTAVYESGLTKDVTDQVTSGALSAGQTSVVLSWQGAGEDETGTCTVSGITVTQKTEISDDDDADDDNSGSSDTGNSGNGSADNSGNGNTGNSDNGNTAGGNGTSDNGNTAGGNGTSVSGRSGSRAGSSSAKHSSSGGNTSNPGANNTPKLPDGSWNPSYRPELSDAGGHFEGEGENWRYVKADGSIAKDEWICSGGDWYYFGSDGMMKTGWFLDLRSGVWYMLNETHNGRFGAALHGWYLDPQDHRWYFLDPVNAGMLLGWQFVNHNWYYLNPERLGQAWFGDDERGWLYDPSSGIRPFGSMYRNEETPDGHAVDENGTRIR